ncbi:twin-arginine translocase TatA/TatE family subunit [Naasia lichenicola]|uniref:Sec-independent protein translocase protein TatA n=1 Tax=Naasia lichenicola TaxID=2565933 RepID=A0A4S4FUB6_9MICO|nr:twin-arginine translocase TatA/TatE family subunit [Naasia lichenicola]THG33405.1 twin-arginine translocase TatA/TatE family subunit [Naasia lichenicola]
MGIFGNAFTGWHLIAILLIVVLLFGAPKLPALARSIATSMKIFKTEIKTDKDETDKAQAETPVVYTEEPPAVNVTPQAQSVPTDSGTTTPKQ